MERLSFSNSTSESIGQAAILGIPALLNEKVEHMIVCEDPTVSPSREESLSLTVAVHVQLGRYLCVGRNVSKYFSSAWLNICGKEIWLKQESGFEDSQ